MKSRRCRCCWSSVDDRWPISSWWNVRISCVNNSHAIMYCTHMSADGRRNAAASAFSSSQIAPLAALRAASVGARRRRSTRVCTRTPSYNRTLTASRLWITDQFCIFSFRAFSSETNSITGAISFSLFYVSRSFVLKILLLHILCSPLMRATFLCIVG